MSAVLRISACATVALAPVEGYLTAVHGQLGKVAPALLTLTWLVTRLRQRRLPRPVPLHAVLAGLAVVLTATAAAHSSGPFTTEYTARWLPFLVVTAVLADVASREVPIRRLMLAAAAGATTAAGGALYSLIAEGAARASGPQSDPNDLAYFLVAAVPLLAALRPRRNADSPRKSTVLVAAGPLRAAEHHRPSPNPTALAAAAPLRGATPPQPNASPAPAPLRSANDSQPSPNPATLTAPAPLRGATPPQPNASPAPAPLRSANDSQPSPNPATLTAPAPLRDATPPQPNASPATRTAPAPPLTAIHPFPSRKAAGIAAVAAGIVLVAGAAATFSRGGALGLAAAGGWLLLRRVLSWRVLAAAGLAVVALGALAFLVARPQFERALGEKSYIAASNVDTRELRWQAAARMLAAHPVLGVGPGGFREHYAAESHNAEVDEQTPVAHDMYLEVAAELGLPGFALFAGVIAVAAVASERTVRLGRGSQRTEAVAIQASLLSVLVTSTFLSEQYYLPLWSLAALAVAGEIRVRREGPGEGSAHAGAARHQ
ncbi:O-antigen ligase family protein [Amycolatopsis australiensis]|uniref:O-antigen ligase like membrane protein n=1 Tax=Amycolatopsis australiensis TaxID=546364 RepID=A0A1K1S1X6_9PSEU|nr:O-antigen ligase family protein [Amycolatopsis australiensis]SFW78154.1 O-antigen ligase like membrane protein [Amycolatopsis australiensis]